MTFKKFIDSVDLENQNESFKNKPRRYGQILMQKLQEVWPDKYNRTIGTEKDPSLSFGKDDDKTIRGFLYNLEAAWPACPANLNKDQVRVQRLEKKIKKLQTSNKRHRKNLEFYKRIVRDFPWVEPTSQTRQENIELRNELKLKGWTIKGLSHDLEYLDNQITDDMIKASEQLAIYVGDSYTIIDGKTISGTDIIKKICAVVKNIKKSINLHQIRKNKNED